MLRVDRALLDDSHFIVQLGHCAVCSQAFVWIFTELVDWEGGGDAQFRDIVPIGQAEKRVLARRADDVDFEFLRSLGRDRRYL